MEFQSPPPFVIRELIHKASWQNGFRCQLGEAEGWTHYGSTTAQGTLSLAAKNPEGPWYIALDHPGVIEELDWPTADIPGPGLQRYAFPNETALYKALPRIYQLSVTLPDAPLSQFQAKTANLPKTTEAERLVVQRVGQNIFRNSLMEYWKGRCPLTGITDPALLRASHIKPWAKCDSDAERLNVYNGLLLSAHWDAAFDAGLVTFDDTGNPIYSKSLTPEARKALQHNHLIPLNPKHRAQLEWHRSVHFHTSNP